MNGSCHCGKIKFETTGKPTWVGKCHCRDCQKISGSAFMAFAEYQLANVTFVSGSPTPYQSSPNVTRTFCNTCGSPIEWRRNDLPHQTSLTLGLFDEKYEFGDMDTLYEEESPDWK